MWRENMDDPIILSPLRDVNSATSPDKVEELRNTNLITQDSKYSYLKYGRL